MKELNLYPREGASFLSSDEIRQAVADSVSEYVGSGKKVLLIIPDYTRYHSNAGLIANTIYHTLTGCEVELLQALGTHFPMTQRECADMYGDIPFEKFIPHDWRNDVVKKGVVPSEFIKELSKGKVDYEVAIEVNRILFDGYDLVLSIGQVVPHEVVGMANYTKNIMVGVGGSDIINKSQ